MKHGYLILGFFFSLFLVSCGKKSGDSSEGRASGGRSESSSQSSEPSNSPDAPSTPVEKAQTSIKNDLDVYVVEKNILKYKAVFPKSGIIEYSVGQSPEAFDYVDRSGNTNRSSTGFHSISLVNVAPEDLSKFPLSKIRELNSSPGGLYVFASKLQEEIAREIIAPVTPSKPGDEFLQYFSEAGKPKFSFSSTFKERFGKKLNLAIDPRSLSPQEQKKWKSIYEELEVASDRTKSSRGQYMFLSGNLAKQASIDFEQKGIIQKIGAWSIAVTGTARRHGFENVPCAEFVSEAIRQAYTRAGYKVTDDFNDAKGNPMIWSNTAAVVNLATALYKAGWIPWEAVSYRPPAGAPMMHYMARSPGHAYLAGGDQGRIIVDNGSPKGRDLRKTSKKIIGLMYMHGIFFMPPGIVPQKW